MTPAVVIICGACHCADTAAKVAPCDTRFEQVGPERWELTGTQLTVVYDPKADSFIVADQNLSRTVYSPDDVVKDTVEIIRRLRDVGEVP